KASILMQELLLQDRERGCTTHPQDAYPFPPREGSEGQVNTGRSRSKGTPPLRHIGIGVAEWACCLKCLRLRGLRVGGRGHRHAARLSRPLCWPGQALPGRARSLGPWSPCCPQK